MRKPTFCICVNKGADQLHRNLYMDSTISLLSKYKISSLKSCFLCRSICVGPGQKPHCLFSHMKAYLCEKHHQITISCNLEPGLMQTRLYSLIEDGMRIEMSHNMRKQTMCFLSRSDKNLAAQKQARILKF